MNLTSPHTLLEDDLLTGDYEDLPQAVAMQDGEGFHIPVSIPANSPRLNLTSPATPNRWDPRLILDLALGVEDLDTVLPRYNLTPDDYETLAHSPIFRRELALTIRDVRENGLPFKAKARVQAEAYLEVLDELVYSDGTPASTRLEAIKSTVAWGGLIPKESKEETGATGSTINVQINF